MVSSMSNEYTVTRYLQDVLFSGTANERAVAHTALKMLEKQQQQTLPVADMTAMVDAAMVEMSNIHPPLRRSECERLIRAALGAPVLHEPQQDKP
jgi:hypothetical protein